MNNWYELYDHQRMKTYRISYDKPLTRKQRIRWRREWEEGKISFRCGCGCPFGINANGAIYYPSDLKYDNIEKKHKENCVRYRKEKTVPVFIIRDIPKSPKLSGIYREDWVDDVEQLIERNKSEWWAGAKVCLREKVSKIESYLKESKDYEEKQLFLIVGRIKEIKTSHFGYKKTIIFTEQEETVSIWVSETFFDGREINRPNVVFFGFCYVRNERWKDSIFKKIYANEGLTV